VYEARKAFRTVRRGGCPEIRLAASELERPVVTEAGRDRGIKQRLSSLETARLRLRPEEEIRIRIWGDHFAGVWQSNHCPPTLKKMIFRTAIERSLWALTRIKYTLSW